MLDARTNLQSSYDNAMAARPTARGSLSKSLASRGTATRNGIAQLRLAAPKVKVSLSSVTAGPTQISNPGGWLSAASSRTDEAVARQFLGDNAGLFGLSGSDLKDVVVLGDSKPTGNGMRMLRVEQQIDGVPVFQSESRFLLTHDGRLAKYVGQIVPSARAGILGTTNLGAADALVKLMAFEGKSYDAASFTQANGSKGNLLLSTSDDYIAGDVTARRVLFPISPGVLVSAWSLVVFTTGDQDWYAIVDAQTGDLLWRKGMRNYASTHDARFRVYVQPDGVTPADSPAPQSPTTATPGSGSQAAAITPTIVSMHTAYDPVASPNGWIDDCPAGGCTANETQTLGNNVLACMDRTTGGANNNVCDTDAGSVLDGNGRPTGNPDAAGRNRDFLGTAPRDFQTGFLPPPQGGNPESGQTPTGAGNNGTLAIDQFRRGVVTHLFYALNWYHDKMYELGFDEAAGNFQQTNFSGNGVGGDRVLADVEDGTGTNNANFSTPPDGTSGRMQMYRFTGPTIDRDGSLDAEIFFHEATHGVSNRLIGNAAGLNWDVGGGMGEGWSDFVALSLLNNTNADDPNGSYAAGAYATYKLTSGYLDNYVYGIRRFPYSTNNSINPLTWADVDDVTNNLSGGIAADPNGFNINGGAEVHNIGEVWALSLWEVRSRVIADPAGANGDVPTGNHTMLQLVVDGMKMTPSDPTFIDARDAILDADCATNACANEESIWAGFADRGLGYGAAEPFHKTIALAASHIGVHESFVVPQLDVVDAGSDVVIDDSATNNNGAIDPGEAVKLGVRLTNPWRAASKAVSAATATLSTSTPGVTIYTNTSTYGAIAPQGSATGTSFTIALDPSVVCGSSIDFTLTTVSDLGTTTTKFSLRVGAANGTDAVVTYTQSTAVAIPDNRPRGVASNLNITDDFQIDNVKLSIGSLTHTFVDDLQIMLRSPNGIGTDQIGLIGLLAADGGSGDNLTNFVVDDTLTPDSTNDPLLAAAAAHSPGYTGSWVPVFNSQSWPSPALGFDGADPVGTLSRYNGTSTKGQWTLLPSDQVAGDAGALNSWSLQVTPTHFDCAAVTPAVAITATKTVSGAFTVGSTVTYTVTLTNNGGGNQADNSGHEFVDALPASLTLVGATPTSGTTTMSGNTVNWDGSLAPLGGSVTITITATVNAGASGTISNQGTVNYDADANGSNEASMLTDDPAVDGASDPTSFVVSTATLAATKTVSGAFHVGGTVTYTVTLSNSGTAASPDNAGHEFVDTLPASLTLVSANASAGTAAMAGNTANWDGSVPAAGSVTITITATVNPGASGAISNQGTVTYDSNLDGTNDTTLLTDDPALPGTADPTSFTVGAVQMSATQTVAGTFHVGGTVTYTVTLTNTGNSASANNAGYEFTETLPSTLTLVGASASAGAASTAGNTANWDGSVPASGSVTITITATINAGASGTISAQGTLSYDADLDGTNDTTSLSDDPSLPGAADPTSFTVGTVQIRATQTVTGTFHAGGTVVYTVTLTNTGNTASPDNAGHEFTETLPSTLTLVGVNESAGAAFKIGSAVKTLVGASASPGAVSTSGNTVNWDGSVPAAGSVTITITATVNSGASGTISAQGTSSYDANLDGTNDTTSLTDDPSLPGTADPTSFAVAAVVTGTAVPAPALSTVALWLLLLGVIALGMRSSVGRRS